MIKFDHIAIGCTTLQSGADYVEKQAGLCVPTGGEHPNMGTHNLVMATGENTFFEVISIDPSATAPGHNRWFGLDDFTGDPRPIAWVLNTDNLERDLELALEAGVDLGRPTVQTRGDMTWRFAVRDDGSIPLDGAAPMLMEWPDMPAHPAANMADLGVRIESILIETPFAAQLDRLLTLLTVEPMPLMVMEAPQTRLGFKMVCADGKHVKL